MPRMGHRFRGFADPKPLGYPGIYRDDAGDEWPGGERLWSPVERSYREKKVFSTKSEELVGSGVKIQ